MAKKVVKSSYDSCTSFVEGYAIVTMAAETGVVDKAGTLALPLRPQQEVGSLFGPFPFVDGQVVIVSEKTKDNFDYDPDTRMGFTLLPEKVETGLVYDNLVHGDIKFGWVRVQKAKSREQDRMDRWERHGGWGMLGASLREILPCEYESIEPSFELHLAKVQKDKKWAIFSLSQEKFMTDFSYDDVLFHAQRVYLRKQNTTEIKTTDLKKTSAAFLGLIAFVDQDSLIIENDLKYGRVSFFGEPITPCIYGSIEEVPEKIYMLEQTMLPDEEAFQIEEDELKVLKKLTQDSYKSGFDIKYEGQGEIQGGQVTFSLTALNAVQAWSIKGKSFQLLVLVEALSSWEAGQVFQVKADKVIPLKSSQKKMSLLLACILDQIHF